jgi:hypothetical protein
MPTNRRHRRQPPRVPLEASLKEWLLHGDFRRAVAAVPAGSTGFTGLGQLLLAGLDHPALWWAYRDELLNEYRAANPGGGMPWGWWEYESRAPRPAPEADDDLDDPDADPEQEA